MLSRGTDAGGIAPDILCQENQNKMIEFVLILCGKAHLEQRQKDDQQSEVNEEEKAQ